MMNVLGECPALRRVSPRYYGVRFAPVLRTAPCGRALRIDFRVTPDNQNPMTEAQYSIIADRMIEEHRKYGDKLRTGHWAEVAARKVVSHIADFRGGQRLFTESEVRGIAMRAISMMSSASKNTLHIGQAAGYVGKACAEAGIKLDPTP
jgi:hypothetical protein